jgi:thiol:disulfide interchange protein DsbD
MNDRWWCAAVAASALFVGAVRAGGDDPFDKKNEAKDFPVKKAAQRLTPQDVLAGKIDFRLEVTPAEVKPGEVIAVKIVGTPRGSNHTYPITKRAPEQLPQQLSRLEYSNPEIFQPLWPVTESPEPVAKTEEGVTLLEYASPFTWTQYLRVKPDATPGEKTLTVTIYLQVCDENGCTQPGWSYRPLQAKVNIQEGKAAATALGQNLSEKQPPVQVVQVGPPPDGNARTTRTTTTPSSTPNTLLGFLGAAFVGAFLMLLTPCVFPMIPITVNFFLKQSEKEHHNPLMMASVYSGTIILVLTVAVLALGKVIITLAVHPWFNFALGAVLIFFALSLFGMYEIELPSFLSRFTSAREGQGGYAGTVFMALTFTITSFTCTGPFLGIMLGSIAQVQPPMHFLVLGALVYATTFAAPFFLLALFPSVIKQLPKSGSWLNAVKVTMGFLELAAALKFLANADLVWSQGDARIFNYDTVLCAWIALSFATGLYLIGVFRLPHDEPVEHIGVVRMVFATIFFGLTVYMVPALRNDRPPQGLIGEGLIAFLPPSFHEPRGGGGAPGNGSELAWHHDYIDAWNEAKKTNKLIFIDFTGVTCTNCRDNENNVFPRPEVRGELAKYVRLRLYTDVVPQKYLPNVPPAQVAAQAGRNQKWQEELGNLTLPYYVVFRPDRERAIENDQLKGEVLGNRDGKINDVADFVQFLSAPLRQSGVQTAQVGDAGQ